MEYFLNEGFLRIFFYLVIGKHLVSKQYNMSWPEKVSIQLEKLVFYHFMENFEFPAFPTRILGRLAVCKNWRLFQKMAGK